jgi:hypothetical protein
MAPRGRHTAAARVVSLCMCLLLSSLQLQPRCGSHSRGRSHPQRLHSASYPSHLAVWNPLVLILLTATL